MTVRSMQPVRSWWGSASDEDLRQLGDSVDDIVAATGTTQACPALSGLWAGESRTSTPSQGTVVGEAAS
jgi:hypothetical protein